MTPKRYDIRKLPDWAQNLLKAKSCVIHNLKRELDEQEIKYETLLYQMREKENGRERKD